MLHVGEQVVLLKGTKVGMGTLKHATRAQIETIQRREDGSPIYQAVWIDSKGKPRSTWIDDSQQTDVPCACGGTDAYWRGDTLREYSCDTCYKKHTTKSRR